MTENQTKPSFWVTLPGILTGVAALLTAVGGLWLVLRPPAPQARPEPQTKVGVAPPPGSTKPGSDAKQPGGGVPVTPFRPLNKSHATITENDPQIRFVVESDSLTWMMQKQIVVGSGEAGSGEAIPFDKIKTISVLDVRDFKTAVQISLTDGQTITGSVLGGRASPSTFEGYTDRGTSVSVRIGEVKQVVIEH